MYCLFWSFCLFKWVYVVSPKMTDRYLCELVVMQVIRKSPNKNTEDNTKRVSTSFSNFYILLSCKVRSEVHDFLQVYSLSTRVCEQFKNNYCFIGKDRLDI